MTPLRDDATEAGERESRALAARIAFARAAQLADLRATWRANHGIPLDEIPQ
jgi:hypothetical protein